jgi:rhodanese-related sulfurtransferase
MLRIATSPALWRHAARASVQIAARNHTLFTPSIVKASALYRFQSTSAKAAKVSEDVKQKLTSEQPAPKVYTYEDIKKLVTNPDPNKILVDVREPSEYQEFSIPTSINIPYKSTPGALDLSPEEFEDIFKFEKPSKDKELIFYCVAGIRSTAAADLAQIFGYEKLGNYTGSTEDWLAHEGKTE